MELPSYTQFIKNRGKQDIELPNAITGLQIKSPYPDKTSFALDYPKGGISVLKVDFTPLNALIYDSPNPLGQTITTNATDTQLTGAKFNIKLDEDNFVFLFAEVYCQLTGANTAANVQFFFKIDGIKHTAGTNDDGDTNVPNGVAVKSSKQFHDIFLLKQGQHTLQLFGRYDLSRNTPNLAVNYFRLSYLPLGN